MKKTIKVNRYSYRSKGKTVKVPRHTRKVAKHMDISDNAIDSMIKRKYVKEETSRHTQRRGGKKRKAHTNLGVMVGTFNKQGQADVLRYSKKPILEFDGD